MYSTFEIGSIEHQALTIASPLPTLTNLIRFTPYLETITTRLESTGHTNLIQAFNQALNNLAEEAPPLYTEDEERLLYYVLLLTIDKRYHHIFHRVSRSDTLCPAIEIMRLLYGESLGCVADQLDEWFGSMDELADRWLWWDWGRTGGFDDGLVSDAEGEDDDSDADDQQVNGLLNDYCARENSADIDHHNGSLGFVGNGNIVDNEDEGEDTMNGIRDDYTKATYVGVDYVGGEPLSREETIKSQLVEYFKGYKELRNDIICSGMDSTLPEIRLIRYAWNDLCKSVLRDICVSLLEANGTWNVQFEYSPFTTLESLEDCILGELSNGLSDEPMMELIDQFNDTEGDVEGEFFDDDVEMHNDQADDGSDGFDGSVNSGFAEQFVQVGEFVANYMEFGHDW
ncbi:unnamed protein product [Ambrosiozyma monospora]|uniref:Unnamed protein product n=1 Tax=Ambrosiozyma monospora TaxID=43982 RepID=A0ACB5U0F1_AMBMO|nr:unnamed protein product [Ambrosiozyma monospora]